jgi:hypothetical protein
MRSRDGGKPIARVVTHVAGRDGFWLTRYLMRHGVETPCAGVEAAGRSSGASGAGRSDWRAPVDPEQEDGILATLGICRFKGLRRDRRRQLAELRQPDVVALPSAALARIEPLLDRLEHAVRQAPTEEQQFVRNVSGGISRIREICEPVDRENRPKPMSNRRSGPLDDLRLFFDDVCYFGGIRAVPFTQDDLCGEDDGHQHEEQRRNGPSREKTYRVNE